MSAPLLLTLWLCAVPQTPGPGAAQIAAQIDAFLNGPREKAHAAVFLLARAPRLARAAIDALLADEKDAPRRTRLAALRRRVLETGLAHTILQRVQSGLIFSGQWSDLTQYDPQVGELLMGIATEERMPAPIREGALNAAADLRLTALLPEIRALAGDILNEDWLIETAGMAMAELGDRTWIDRRIAALEHTADDAGADITDRYASLKLLAQYRYRLGEYDRSIDVYARTLDILAARLATLPEEKAPPLRRTLWLTYYNTACSASKAGRLDDAFAYLRKSLETDTRPEAVRELEMNLQQDGDLRNVRTDPRYRALLEEFRSAAARSTAEEP